MRRFVRLTVKGFRRLADVDLELRPLNVLIGANGVGKTSLLDVLSILSSSAQGNLNTAIGEMSGLPAIITYDRSSEMDLRISLEGAPTPVIVNGQRLEGQAAGNTQPLDYLLGLRPHGAAYDIYKETLQQGRRGGGFGGPRVRMHIDSQGGDIKYFEDHAGKPLRPTWEHNPLESSLSQVPKMYREPEEFRQKLASSALYHSLSVEPRSPVRLPQAIRPAPLPGKNGEDLVSCLFYLRETERDRFEAVEDSLKVAFPGFKRLDFPPVAAGTLAMTWRDSNFSQPLYMHQLSEGILRFLWIATLLQSPGLPAVTLLDEPEVSLHPELLSLLAGLLREAAGRTQLLVATHSDRLIRFLQPDEVVVMDSLEDGSSTLTWADSMNLKLWLEQYTLDELWHSGRLGTRS
ncbi:MAG: AAA family ATPase [Bryobacteraceae bacterium]